jgi:hypothetical protein
MDQPPDSLMTECPASASEDLEGKTVNEHSFILNQSPHDGKGFRPNVSSGYLGSKQ